MYATKQISPKLTLGFGLYAPYGLAAEFHQTSTIRPAGYEVRRPLRWKSRCLADLLIQPTFAYKITRQQYCPRRALVYSICFIEQSILNPLGTMRSLLGVKLPTRSFPAR